MGTFINLLLISALGGVVTYWVWRVFGLVQAQRAKKQDGMANLSESFSRRELQTTGLQAIGSRSSCVIKREPQSVQKIGEWQSQFSAAERLAEARACTLLRQGGADVAASCRAHLFHLIQAMKLEPARMFGVREMYTMMKERQLTVHGDEHPEFIQWMALAERRQERVIRAYPHWEMRHLAAGLERSRSGLGVLSPQDLEFILYYPDALMLQHLQTSFAPSEAAVLLSLMAPTRAKSLLSLMSDETRQQILSCMLGELAKVSCLGAEKLVTKLKSVSTLAHDEATKIQAARFVRELYQSFPDSRELAGTLGQGGHSRMESWLDTALSNQGAGEKDVQLLEIISSEGPLLQAFSRVLPNGSAKSSLKRRLRPRRPSLPVMISDSQDSNDSSVSNVSNDSKDASFSPVG